MPQRRSAIKELRKNRKNRLHNLDIKTDLKKTIKKFTASVEQKNSEEAKENLKTVYKKIDKAAKRNILHQNTASRRKSKFSKAVADINK
ncbi:MAG: 30S ribosomal protein S20 [Candidatus Omnitrophica bacterium]|nr:30S ribosomal protein S20 [Candidatus Omnitrophota bacterium]